MINVTNLSMEYMSVISASAPAFYGAGGRIAIYFKDFNLSGSVDFNNFKAYGGSPGTIYLNNSVEYLYYFCC